MYCLVGKAQAQDVHQESNFLVSVHVASANIPLGKGTLMAKPKVKGRESIFFLCEAVADVRVCNVITADWGIRINNSIYHIAIF